MPVKQVRLGAETVTEQQQVTGEVRKAQIDTDGLDAETHRAAPALSARGGPDAGQRHVRPVHAPPAASGPQRELAQPDHADRRAEPTSRA